MCSGAERSQTSRSRSPFLLVLWQILSSCFPPLAYQVHFQILGEAMSLKLRLVIIAIAIVVGLSMAVTRVYLLTFSTMF